MKQRKLLVAAAVFTLSACATGDEVDYEESDQVEPDDVEVEEALGDVVCFDGKGGAVCWYLYGDPFNDGIANDSYMKIPSGCSNTWGIVPIAHFRYWKMNPNTYVANNFRLKEFLTLNSGPAAIYSNNPYLLLQPHAVTRLQNVRNSLGKALKLNSAYRPPGYNKKINGATCSRHMYGDAFDIAVPSGVSKTGLANACKAQGAWTQTYANTNHVHCDFRNVAADSRMFAQTVRAPDEIHPTFGVSADILVADGVLSAPATGFDEGEPTREWTAYDADGTVLVIGEGEQFRPPAEATNVTVLVGSAVEAELDL